MKHLYNISKAQLITLWVFGVIATLWGIDKVSYMAYSSQSFSLPEFVSWFVPLALFFYTLGWRDRQKKK